MLLIYKIINRKSFVDLNFKQWVYEIYKSAYLDIIMISIFIKFTKEIVMHCLLLSFNSYVILWTFLLTRSFTSQWTVRPTKSADRPGRNRRHLWSWNEVTNWPELTWFLSKRASWWRSISVSDFLLPLLNINFIVHYNHQVPLVITMTFVVV